MIRGFGASWKADIYTHKAAQIVFNNNYDHPSNIKGIGNSINDFWHLAQTAHFSILLSYYFLVSHGYHKFVCMFSAKTYWRMLFTSLASSVIF